ncbi:MAG: hypothetical protein ABFC91_06470 [Methanobacteriaceae archaeon]
MKFNLLAIFLGLVVIVAIFFGILLFLGHDTSSLPVSADTETAGYKTFNNSYLSFQYPSNLTVTELNALNGVQINTNNPVDPSDQNYGIFIRVMDKSEYLAAKDEAASNWQLEYELENSGGVSYSQYTHSNGNVTLYTYIFSKNGKYYNMYGNVEDDYLMVQLLDSIQ